MQCGERVDKGTLVGRLMFPTGKWESYGTLVGRYIGAHGDIVEEVKSPHACIVLAINPGPAMATGDVLVHIGLDPRDT